MGFAHRPGFGQSSTNYGTLGTFSAARAGGRGVARLGSIILIGPSLVTNHLSHKRRLSKSHFWRCSNQEFDNVPTITERMARLSGLRISCKCLFRIFLFIRNFFPQKSFKKDRVSGTHSEQRGLVTAFSLRISSIVNIENIWEIKPIECIPFKMFMIRRSWQNLHILGLRIWFIIYKDILSWWYDIMLCGTKTEKKMQRN